MFARPSGTEWREAKGGDGKIAKPTSRNLYFRLPRCPRPRGKILRPGGPIKHGRFFYSKAKDCARCSLARACLPRGRVNKAIVISHDYPALLRARRRRDRWSTEDQRLYRRHRWRSEGFHGEAKTWHGLARAVRRGLSNMKIQAYLTAAAINLKRLAAALMALWWPFLTFRRPVLDTRAVQMA